MARRTDTLPPISNRALNRATLARQGLLERQPGSVRAMLAHLIGMQGQVHNAPYVGLWSRLTTFSASDLEALLKSGAAVRATLQRVTLHVATAEDFLAIRPLIDPVAWRGFRTNHLKPLNGADVEAIRAAGRELLDAGVWSPAALGKQLQARWPDVEPVPLSMVARFLDPVVHVPPAGLWGATGAPEITSAQNWLGRTPEVPIDFDALVLRYLTAFGPASGADFNAWSGLSGGPAAMERLRPKLVSFAAETGREVFDLPEAPRPSEAVAAPVRLLPDYDNVIVGYDDRTRIVSAEAFRGLWRANGLRPAYTVDGMVAGSWRLTLGKGTASIALLRFAPLRSEDEAALEREAWALLAALAPDRAAAVTVGDFLAK